MLAVAWMPTLAMGHGAFHDVVAELTVALKKDPNDPALHFKLAAAYCDHGDWQVALDYLEKVEQLAPEKFPTDLVRGQSLLTGERAAEAKAALDRFLSIQPENAPALMLRARAQQRLGATEAALADFREAFRRSATPEADHVQEFINALVAKGLRDEASQTLAEAIAKLGPVPSLLLKALELDLAAGCFDEALSHIDTLQQSAARPEPWMERRAAVLEQAGRSDEARSAWQTLLAHIAGLPAIERGSYGMRLLAEKAQRALGIIAAPAPVSAPPATPLSSTSISTTSTP